jgi:hypothetical protein
MYSLRECCDKPIDGKERQDIIHWPSDYSIVSRKSVKADGEKGVAVMRRGSRETPAGHTELGDRWQRNLSL